MNEEADAPFNSSLRIPRSSFFQALEVVDEEGVVAVGGVGEAYADDEARVRAVRVELLVADGRAVEARVRFRQLDRDAQSHGVADEVAPAHAHVRQQDPEPVLAQVARAPLHERGLRAPLRAEQGDGDGQAHPVARRAPAVGDELAQAARNLANVLRHPTPFRSLPRPPASLLRRVDGLAARVLALYAVGVHVEGEAARAPVALGLGARDVGLRALADRDREAVARGRAAEYVARDEARVHERVEVSDDPVALDGVGYLGGLYALEHVLGVLLVRDDALLEEELLALPLHLGRVGARAHDPRAAREHEVDRLDLDVTILLVPDFMKTVASSPEIDSPVKSKSGGTCVAMRSKSGRSSSSSAALKGSIAGL